MKPGTLINFDRELFLCRNMDSKNGHFSFNGDVGSGLISIVRPEKINIFSILPIKRRQQVVANEIGLRRNFTVGNVDEVVLKAYFIKRESPYSDVEYFVDQLIKNNYVVDGFEVLIVNKLQKAWVSQNFVNYYFNKEN